MSSFQVGVVGAGRVGAVLAAALRSAGHEITAAAGDSDASLARIGALLPGVANLKPSAVARSCDVLLLTEVSDRVDLAGTLHAAAAEMAKRRRWAAIWSRHPITPLPDPHGASAMAEIEGLRFGSSVLPWRTCGSRSPWVGNTTEERTRAAVAAIAAARPDVWGGDWNHALVGREYAGSAAGRRHLLAALRELRIDAPTATAPHQIEGLLSIDHVAVPIGAQAPVEHHSALVAGGRLSDHDAYVVEVEPRVEGGARPDQRRQVDDRLITIHH